MKLDIHAKRKANKRLKDILCSINFLFCFSKVTVSLRYADLISVLPTRISVLAWPMFNKNTTATLNRKEDGLSGSHSTPIRLTYAEDALRTMSLPEGALTLFLFLNQLSVPYEHMIIS